MKKTEQIKKAVEIVNREYAKLEEMYELGMSEDLIHRQRCKWGACLDAFAEFFNYENSDEFLEETY